MDKGKVIFTENESFNNEMIVLIYGEVLVLKKTNVDNMLAIQNEQGDDKWRTDLDRKKSIIVPSKSDFLITENSNLDILTKAAKKIMLVNKLNNKFQTGFF